MSVLNLDSCRLIAPDKSPLGGSLAVGFAASLCCGGGLLFGAIGLGAFYSALRMARYIPEALATGAILIALVNWLYYRRKTLLMVSAGTRWDRADLHVAMLIGGFLGLVMMAGSFTLLEWLNHTVIDTRHSHEHAGTLIAGVPNSHLAYLAAAFLVLPVLAFLSLPRSTRTTSPVGVASA